MKKPARRAKPAAPNVDIVDKVNGLAAGLNRALRETGWSMRGLAINAGLTADRLRNVGRGRSTKLQGDALNRIAEMLGTEPGVLNGSEAWPAGGLRPRPRPVPIGRKGFSISADPLADLVRAAEMAAEAANVAASAARQAAEAVKMAISRRSYPGVVEMEVSVEAPHRQPKASKIDPLDRMACRMRYQGMVRVLDEFRQVQLGCDALSMVGWSPLVAVTILGKTEYLVEDLVTGDHLGIYPSPSEAVEVAMMKAKQIEALMRARSRHPMACMKLRSLGAGADTEYRLADPVDEAHEIYIEHFFRKLVKQIKAISTEFDGALKTATEKAARQVEKSFLEFVETRQMTPEQLYTLASLCMETSQRVRRSCVVMLAGLHYRELSPLCAIAYLELSGERLFRIAASGRVTPFQTYDEQRANGYVRDMKPSPGLPDSY